MTPHQTLRLLRRMIAINIAGSVVYRANFVFFMLGTIIGPIVSALVWQAAVASGAELPVDGSYLMTYFVLLSLVTMLTSSWLANFLADAIRDGRLSVWLARPGSFLYELAANNVAEKVVKLVVLVPMIAIFGLIVRDSLAVDVVAWRWIAVLASVGMAAIIVFACDVIIGALGFWLEDVSGIAWGQRLLVGLLAGQFVPLAIMPVWTQTFLQAQPFRYTVSFPLEIVVGNLTSRDMVIGLFVQLAYAALFVGMAREIWSRGLRSYSAAGA